MKTTYYAVLFCMLAGCTAAVQSNPTITLKQQQQKQRQKQQQSPTVVKPAVQHCFTSHEITNAIGQESEWQLVSISATRDEKGFNVKLYSPTDKNSKYKSLKIETIVDNGEVVVSQLILTGVAGSSWTFTIHYDTQHVKDKAGKEQEIKVNMRCYDLTKK